MLSSSIVASIVFVLSMSVVSSFDSNSWSAPFLLRSFANVRSSSTCGTRGSVVYCVPALSVAGESARSCVERKTCDSRRASVNHPPSDAVDDRRWSWWQSEPGQTAVTFTVDLGQKFQVSQIRVDFKTAPADRWLIRASRDDGRSFTPLHYFVVSASECVALYGLAPGRISGSRKPACFASYRTSNHLWSNEVTIDLLRGRPGSEYGLTAAVKHFVTIDHVQLEFHAFGPPWNSPSTTPQGYYAVTEITVVARCRCCGPSSAPCTCCRRRREVSPEARQEESSANHGGGELELGCRCKEAGVEPSPNGKRQLNCSSPRSSLSDKTAEGDGATNSQRCLCKKNVVGRRCHRCRHGYYRLRKRDPLGCRDCECDERGSKSIDCDRISGKCRCLVGFAGRRCDRCVDGYGDLFPNCHGCGRNCSESLLGAIALLHSQLATRERIANVQETIPKRAIDVEATLVIKKDAVQVLAVDVLTTESLLSKVISGVKSNLSVASGQVSPLTAKVGTVVHYLADAKQECRHQLKKSLNVLRGGINASASLEEHFASLRQMRDRLRQSVSTGDLLLRTGRTIVNGMSEIDMMPKQVAIATRHRQARQMRKEATKRLEETRYRSASASKVRKTLRKRLDMFADLKSNLQVMIHTSHKTQMVVSDVRADLDLAEFSERLYGRSKSNLMMRLNTVRDHVHHARVAKNELQRRVEQWNNLNIQHSYHILLSNIRPAIDLSNESTLAQMNRTRDRLLEEEIERKRIFNNAYSSNHSAIVFYRNGQALIDSGGIFELELEKVKIAQSNVKRATIRSTARRASALRPRAKQRNRRATKVVKKTERSLAAIDRLQARCERSVRNCGLLSIVSLVNARRTETLVSRVGMSDKTRRKFNNLERKNAKDMKRNRQALRSLEEKKPALMPPSYYPIAEILGQAEENATKSEVPLAEILNSAKLVAERQTEWQERLRSTKKMINRLERNSKSAVVKAKLLCDKFC
ncbi:uncharacterized protein [Oscarella lobularis]|uniref:uncharacterized protein n=1 Tax=Oscarella lobularis TaxID=121494 RepID=UPI003313331A